MKEILTIFRDEIYSIIFGLLIFCSTVILLIQPPFLFYSPDISYHAAKILRVMHGEFFTDPVSGFTSYYPPLFHILIGIGNNLIQFSPVDLIKGITILNLIGLLLLIYLITYWYTNQRSLAAICAAGSGLTFYEFSMKYILLANPYNTALLFALFGISIVLLGLLKKNRGYLAAGIMFLVICSGMWYYNVILLFSTILTLLIVYTGSNTRMKEKSIPIFLFFFLFSGIALFLDWISPAFVRWVSPVATITPDIVYQTLISFICLGNERFLEMLNPYSSDIQPIWIISPSVLFILFFGIIIPINVFFFGYPFYVLYQKKDMFKHEDFFLLLLSIFILIFSIGSHFIESDGSRIIRIQYISHLFFMILSISLLSRTTVQSTWKKVQIFIFSIGSILILLTVLHNPFGLVQSGPDADTQEIITYIDSIPDHEHTRIFMTDTTTCSLYEFVPFFSYTYHRRYGVWDPSQGDNLSSIITSYDRIISFDPHWKEILRQDNTEFMIFDCIEGGLDYTLAEKYINETIPVWNNERWLVLKPNLTIEEN